MDGRGVTGIVMVSLLVCLIPTTIGALLSAIGIAGMDRLVQRNVLAMSGRAVEAAGDVNMLLLDKTGNMDMVAGKPKPVLPTAPTPLNTEGGDDLALQGAPRQGAGRRDRAQLAARQPNWSCAAPPARG